MLVLNGIEEIGDDELKDMVVQFRKSQVSRYPIETLIGREDMIGFVDSRFPTTRYNKDDMLAIVWTDQTTNRNGAQVTQYVIESRLIRNDKYASHNSDF